MDKLERYKILVSKQLEDNLLINIFSDDIQLTFDDNLVSFLKTNNLNDKEEIDLVRYCISNLLFSLYKYNQYINFPKKSYLKLQEIYEELIREFKEDVKKEVIERNHYQRIKNFLIETNPFLGDINKNGIKTFANTEYSYQFQMNLFSLDINNLKGPILDIGCGEKHSLVTYLNDNNVEAYGIDRFDSDKTYIIKDDFLSFDYKDSYWSMILSNMAFSNHFNRHLLFKDSLVKDFHKAYLAILKSLRIGGKFLYAPAVFEMEKTLDKKTYEVSYEEVAYGLFTVCIKRIR